jgi:hypothetical protein
MRALKMLGIVFLFLITLSVQPAKPVEKEGSLSNRATGTFEVKITPLAPYNQEDKTLGRFSIDKQFHGDLEVTGKLNGRSGSFVLQHSATMENGKPHMTVFVVPGSGSGELSGISGTMDIVIEPGKHSYVFTYTL